MALAMRPYLIGIERRFCCQHRQETRSSSGDLQDREAKVDPMVASRSQESLARALTQGLARAVLVAVGGSVGMAFGTAAAMLVADSPAPERHATSVDAGRTDAGGRVVRLVAEHGCWTEDAPPGHTNTMPGHVVVSVEGRARYSSRLVGAALDHVFTAPREELVVHAFCP